MTQAKPTTPSSGAQDGSSHKDTHPSKGLGPCYVCGEPAVDAVYDDHGGLFACAAHLDAASQTPTPDPQSQVTGDLGRVMEERNARLTEECCRLARELTAAEADLARVEAERAELWRVARAILSRGPKAGEGNGHE